jgi:hypothetical protein
MAHMTQRGDENTGANHGDAARDERSQRDRGATPQTFERAPGLRVRQQVMSSRIALRSRSNVVNDEGGVSLVATRHPAPGAHFGISAAKECFPA